MSRPPRETDAAPPPARRVTAWDLRWSSEYAFLRLFFLGSLLIPRSVHRLLGRAVVLLLERLLRGTTAAIRKNLERILLLPPDAPPARARREVRRRARRALLNFGTYLFDHAYFTLGPPERGRELTQEVSGLEALTGALSAGRGVILATAHLGFWDLGAAALAGTGHGLSVVALSGGDPRTNRYRDRARARRRIEILWTDQHDAVPALLGALRRLREGRVVALLADRATGGALERVPFMGREIAFPAGAAALARASGAPIVPAFVVLDERTLRYRATFEPPIAVPRTDDRARDLRAGTAALASVIERYVRAYPEQWWSFYDFFGEERPGRQDQGR